VLAALIAVLLLPVQVQAVGPDDSDSRKIDYVEMGRRTGHGLAVGFDAVVIRPLTVCATIIGAVLFVPVFLISAAGGAEARNEAYELFIEYPAKAVYQRPLGEF
jgi:hypothetical protein